MSVTNDNNIPWQSLPLKQKASKIARTTAIVNLVATAVIFATIVGGICGHLNKTVLNDLSRVAEATFVTSAISAFVARSLKDDDSSSPEIFNAIN